MTGKNLKTAKKGLLIPLICIISLVAIGGGVYFWFQSNQIKSKQNTSHQETQVLPGQPVKTFQAIPGEKVIDYNRVDEDENLQAIIQERKKQFGLDNGVDVIVRSDESFKVGDSIIPMKEILEKIRIKRGNVTEEGLADKPHGKISENQDLGEKSDDFFGIYVVKPNDNLWNIHFRFLQDYFDNKNIRLSPLADKPNTRGFSSGVGKILKFSENVVYIYNVRERKMDVNLNLLYSESEIVVFHMAEILSLLDQIDLENVNKIRFDGESLWISVES
jgi:hypothetical protein